MAFRLPVRCTSISDGPGGRIDGMYGRRQELHADRQGGDRVGEFRRVAGRLVRGRRGDPGVRGQIGRRNEQDEARCPEASVVTTIEPSGFCPWPKPEGSGIWLVKNWIRKRRVGQAVQRPLNAARRAAADGRHQNRVILQVIGTGRDSRLVGSDSAGRVSGAPRGRCRACRWRRCCWRGSSCRCPSRRRRRPGR